MIQQLQQNTKMKVSPLANTIEITRDERLAKIAKQKNAKKKSDESIISDKE